ncbi:DNA alkylation repair protein [Hyphobacterium sp. CCMP332]|nr:DNA alkylation repair protein [Hyphobacterium sp. CCMP332]
MSQDFSVTDYVKSLENEFKRNANPQNAINQKAYMRDQFEFYGIKAGLRSEIIKPFIQKQLLPPKSSLEIIVKTLWQKPQREFQNFAQELTEKYSKQFEKSDIDLLEYMVMNNSWWDTVDFIAYKLMGAYFRLYPEEIPPRINKYLNSDNIWLQRSAILFQLKYKKNTDTELLAFVINHLLGSREFFINKAIGWVLREYSRINPPWVLEFVDNTELSNLSKKEALRLILKDI